MGTIKGLFRLHKQWSNCAVFASGLHEITQRNWSAWTVHTQQITKVSVQLVTCLLLSTIRFLLDPSYSTPVCSIKHTPNAIQDKRLHFRHKDCSRANETIVNVRDKVGTKIDRKKMICLFFFNAFLMTNWPVSSSFDLLLGSISPSLHTKDFA